MAAQEAGEKSGRVWPLEKYARFVRQHSAGGGSAIARKSDGIWQHYSSREGDMRLALIDSNHLVVSSGTMIFESFSLWDAQKWLKVVTRGDSAMFIYKVKNDCRRFRVKFLPVSSQSTAVESCRHFASQMAPLVPIKEMESALSTRDKDISTCDRDISTRDKPGVHERDSQLMSYGEDFSLSQVIPELLDTQTTEPQQPAGATANASGDGPILTLDESTLMPIPDIGKVLQTQGKSLGRAYADTNFPTDQLGQFIRLCLTDSNFPAFVDAVEKELANMTS